MLDDQTGHVNADEVSYLILEPVQGEGGYRFPSDAFAAEIAAVCDRHDLTLVVDEIQAGVGRSGEFWATDHYPFEPDVIASAKGLRVGATIASEDVFPDERSRLSSTWGAGDLVATMQGALTIDIIQEDDLMDNATRKGERFIAALDERTLDGVEDVRGKGLLLAVEFDTKQRRDDVLDAALARGLLTLGCGRRTLRILPPLDVRDREIDMGVDILTDAIESVA